MSTFPDNSHLQMLMNAREHLAAAIPVLDAAESCGVDCTEYRQGHAELSRRVETYLGMLFPDSVKPGPQEGGQNVPR